MSNRPVLVSDFRPEDGLADPSIDRDSPPLNLELRGVPIHFFNNRWGGYLHAAVRGYCPFSPTGYRSLAGAGPQATAPAALFLEHLADDKDRQSLGILRLTQRVIRTRPSGDTISNYIHATSCADRAVSFGFFAKAEHRGELWQAAYRVYALMGRDERFHPQPNGRAWNEALCARNKAALPVVLAWLGELLRGNITLPPAAVATRWYEATTYLGLPARAEGEPSFSIPAADALLPMDLPPEFEPDSEEDDDCERPDDDAPEAAEAAGSSPAQQLDLF